MPSDKSEKFLKALVNLCKYHDVSIAHEDLWGAFVITDYDEDHIKWIRDATDLTTERGEVEYG